MFTNKTILIAPLDWGFGHATRCVPIIRELQKNNKIILGVTPLTSTILEEEFPQLPKISLPEYKIRYSTFLPLWLKLIFDSRRISKVIKAEKDLTNEIIEKNKIDVVISDNRFGLYSKKTHSVFITHQLFLKSPFVYFAQNINKNYILNFNEVWVPDFENEAESLSGELSHGIHFHKKVKYIGPKSRLQKTDGEKKYDYLFLLSGPEPQRSIFKNLLVEKVIKYPNLNFAMVSPEPTKTDFKNIQTFISPSQKNLSEIICASHKIICRSGYSTLMDLYFLEKKEIILVPTPGQTAVPAPAPASAPGFSPRGSLNAIGLLFTYPYKFNPPASSMGSRLIHRPNSAL